MRKTENQRDEFIIVTIFFAIILFFFHFFSQKIDNFAFNILKRRFNESSNPLYLLVLYIDLRPGQTFHSKDEEVACSIGVGGLG